MPMYPLYAKLFKRTRTELAVEVSNASGHLFTVFIPYWRGDTRQTIKDLAREAIVREVADKCIICDGLIWLN